MMRLLALSLLAANAVLFAWTQGWLGALAPRPPSLQGREPERLQQQVRPEALMVLRPRAASAAAVSSDVGASAAAGTRTPDRSVDSGTTLPPGPIRPQR